jgi:hypothetical protein
MEILFIVVLIVVILAGWVKLSERIRELETSLRQETDWRHDLAARIAKLETAPATQAAQRAPTPELKPISTPSPPKLAPESAKEPAHICQFCGRKIAHDAAICFCGAVIDARRVPPPLPEPPPLPKPAPATPSEPSVLEPAIPRETLRDKLHRNFGDREWEAMVGGSWLNKLGVLVLVIAIVSLLQYEFGRVGPAGRVAIGYGISLAMLIAGVVIERKPGFAVFARGLIGGGWAALYFTTYAMHALPAARVIDNPIVGSVILLIVAAGMIGHSLHYRSQTVSGLAYFIAFGTLALSETTPFAVLALIPLAASLLVLAYRFDWYRMAVFGLFATYATCASRPDTGAPLASTEALFASYWLLFEIFDQLRVRKRVLGFSIESLILPLNSLGYLTLAIVKWHRSSPDNLYVFLAAVAAVYAISAISRAYSAPPDSEQASIERIASGGYEGPITIAAVLAAVAIFLRANGAWINLGWLIEGEILFLIGVRFRQLYLRNLAGAAFVATLGKLMGTDVPQGGSTIIAGKTWMSWTPVTILTAAVFYANRLLRVAESAVYSWAGAGLVALVLGYEIPQQWISLAWLVFAGVLFELGFRRSKDEFLFQSYAIGALGTIACFLVNVFASVATWRWPWLPIAIAAAIHYTATLRIRFGGTEKVGQPVAWCTSISTVALLVALIGKFAPGDYRGIAWLALGAVLLELGLRGLPQHFRRLSYIVSTLGVIHVFYFHVLQVHKGSGRIEMVCLSAAAVICCAIAARVFRAMPERMPETERSIVRDLQSAFATMFALTLAWLVLPAPIVALAWAAASLILLELGFTFSLPRFRAMGNAVAAIVFARLFFANFTDLGNTLRISHRLLTVAPIIVSEYYVWSRYRLGSVEAWERTWVRLYLYAPAVLAVVLMRFELGRSIAVIGWALLGLALYRLGWTRELVDLRWQSYAIALLAMWRCWSTNFYIPESLLGIQGRVLTGGLVVASFYCAQLISPRESSGQGRIDRHARTFYTLLAALLLGALLFYEVSGGMLTVAWGIEGLALLGAGFPLRDRVQRLSGLALFLVCVLKLFLYDLRELETVNRIISFVVLGVILVSVSWVYTRFRDRIQRYL